MKLFLSLLIALFALTVSSRAQAQTADVKPTILQERAAQLIGLINAPTALEKTFALSFLKAISPEKWSQINTGLTDTYGKAIAVKEVTPVGDYSGQIEIIFEKDAVAAIEIKLEEVPPHLISELLITGIEKTSDSFEAVTGEFRQLPGQTAFSAVRLDGDALKPLAAYNADQSLAIGSAFKLYVLAELIRSIEVGDHRWDEVVPLSVHSLPSGQLQNWPLGAPLTLHSLATLMISNSDNTATDQLIEVLGREAVEKMLTTAGNNSSQRNIPFLKTIEMFKLKGALKENYASRYVSGDVAAKRALLAREVAAFAISDIDLGFLAKPSYLDQIEWFASPNDLARAMNWIRLHSDAPQTAGARGILAVNKALSKAQAEAWQYSGFKGGSETGVINLSYLLQSKNGSWYAVSGTWNDKDSAVDDGKFVFLMQRVVQIVAKQSN